MFLRGLSSLCGAGNQIAEIRKAVTKLADGIRNTGSTVGIGTHIAACAASAFLNG
jgi:hypothetical protein